MRSQPRLVIEAVDTLSEVGVSEDEITDIPAYNRANGIMWICYSLVFWISAIMGLFKIAAAGIVLIVGCLAGTPILVIAYGRIYKKYKVPLM